MNNNDIQFLGGSCGHHGPYTFYKAFKYTKNGVKRIVTISEFFFVKLWMDSDLLCIGELQLLWIDKNSEQVLASLRLYFLPENTPEGRMDHGEDEVLAIAEKVVLRVEDLVTWITVDAEWTWGRLGRCSSEIKEPPDDKKKRSVSPVPLVDSSLDFTDIDKERKNLGCYENEGQSVVILSYPQYCRYRAMMRRLEGVESSYLKYNVVKALGGFSVKAKDTKVMFCRDTFEYPELEGHELLCNHLAPKLKGRPRGKRKKRSVSPGSESNESESSVTNIFTTAKKKVSTESGRNGLRCEISSTSRRSTRSTDNNESKVFLQKLNTFMKTNRTPLGRIPSLGYKELDLHEFYTKVEKLGGYDFVTSNRLWKSIFDDMSGHQNSTSAATVIRRHYERFLLSYERHIRGEEYKPTSERRLKTKASSNTSDAETSESTSHSGATTPVHLSNTVTSPISPHRSIENKDPHIHRKLVGKPSSLRHIRVKSERLKVKITKIDKVEDTSPSDALEIVKIESNQCTKIKPEEYIQKVEIIPIMGENLIEKGIEPSTSAIAPIVQKTLLDKIPPPNECREDISIIKTGDTANISSKTFETIEVPYKHKRKSPDKLVVDTLQSNTSTSDTSFILEVKKQKLDILKEGGLEVTPVKSNYLVNTSTNDRPSVIHQPITSAHIIPTIRKTETEQMIAPRKVNSSTKRLGINIPQSLNISRISSESTITKAANKSSTNTTSYTTEDSMPPRVVQSRSIYTYSENTIYGNPKDFLTTSISPAQTPKMVNLNRHPGGDILDLTVTSPQKPSVEIMKVPNIPMNSRFSASYRNMFSKNSSSKTNSLSLLDGRKLGSNLEITLVGGPNNRLPIQSGQGSQYKFSSSSSSNSTVKDPYSISKSSYSQKHSSNENNVSHRIPRVSEIGKHARTSSSSSSKASRERSSLNPNISRPHSNELSFQKPESSSSQSKSVPQSFSPHTKNSSSINMLYPPYFPQLYESSKSVQSYFPMLDPMLYSAAMQSLYTQNTPPMLQYTHEHLKYYSELVAQNSQFQFPFQLQDGNSSLLNNSNSKKP